MVQCTIQEALDTGKRRRTGSPSGKIRTCDTRRETAGKSLEERWLTYRRISRVQLRRQFVGTAVARSNLRKHRHTEANRDVRSFARSPAQPVCQRGQTRPHDQGRRFRPFLRNGHTLPPVAKLSRATTGKRTKIDALFDAQSVCQINEAPLRRGMHGGLLNLEVLDGSPSTADEEIVEHPSRWVPQFSVIGDRLVHLRVAPISTDAALATRSAIPEAPTLRTGTPNSCQGANLAKRPPVVVSSDSATALRTRQSTMG